MSIAFTFNVAFYCDISESLSHTKCCLYHKIIYCTIKSRREEIIITNYNKIGLQFIK